MEEQQRKIPDVRFLRVYGSKADPIRFFYGVNNHSHEVELLPGFTIAEVKHQISHRGWLGNRIKPVFFKLYLFSEEEDGTTLGEPLDMESTLASHLDGNDCVLVLKFLEKEDIVMTFIDGDFQK